MQLAKADALTDMIDSMDSYNEQQIEYANELMRSRKVIEFRESVDSSKMYRAVQDDIPKINNENTVYMGDRMLEQREGMFVECLVPLVGGDKTQIGGFTSMINLNELLCKHSKKDKNYTPTYINGITGDGNPNVMEVKLSGKKDGKYKICTRISGFNNFCLKKLSSKDFRYTTGFLSVESGMQRVIEYGGKKNSIIKFIYSEFKDGYIRDAFTREFEIDLSEGNVAAYKGAIIEIIKADNSSITYEVKRHFQ